MALFLILEIPFYTSYLTFWLIRLSTGSHPTLVALFSDAMKYPVHIGFNFINTVIYLFSSIAFLLAYYQFIKDFDYPTLRQVTGKT